MIKNLIFDMGNVIIRFDPDLFIGRLGLTPADSKLLKREIFQSLEWAMQDRGSLTEAESSGIICRRVPQHLQDAVKELIFHWNRPLLPVEGMEALLRGCKENGYRIFLLSNASSRLHEYWPDVPGQQYFDDLLVSADVGLVKPEPELFRLAMERFQIRPDETVFIDDLSLNAEAAYHAGMHAIVFYNDVPRLRRELNDLGVRTVAQGDGSLCENRTGGQI